MNLISILVLFLTGLASQNTLWAQGENAVVKTETLSDLINEAMAKNPEIRSAKLEVDALHSSPEHRWYLNPPEIGIDFYQTPLSSFPNPFKKQQEYDYSVKQSFPFPGKIAARIEAEYEHANMGEADLQLKKNTIKQSVKTHYYDIYLRNKRIQFNQENQSWLMEKAIAVRHQYEQGIGRQIDLLRIQSELTELKSENLNLAQSKQAIMLELLSLLNREGNINVTVTDTLLPTNINFNENDLAKIISDNHPALQNLQRAKKMQMAQQSIAHKELYPDFEIGGVYKNMPNNTGADGIPLRENFWSVSAAVTLPFAFWSAPKYKASIDQSTIKLSQADEEIKNTRNQLTALARSVYLNIQNQKAQQKIIEEQLIPQSEQTLAATEIAYRNGKADLKDLLEAFQLRLKIKENLVTTLTQIMMNEAELENVLGVDLNTIYGELK